MSYIEEAYERLVAAQRDTSPETAERRRTLVKNQERDAAKKRLRQRLPKVF